MWCIKPLLSFFGNTCIENTIDSCLRTIYFIFFNYLFVCSQLNLNWKKHVSHVLICPSCWLFAWREIRKIWKTSCRFIVHSIFALLFYFGIKLCFPAKARRYNWGVLVQLHICPRYGFVYTRANTGSDFNKYRPRHTRKFHFFCQEVSILK